MKISRNVMKWYGGQGLDLPAAELVNKIGSQIGAVEEYFETGAQYDGAVVVKIVSCVDHPNADRLHVCKIDDGGVVKDVTRDENDHVEVVCGAPNAREGISVVWLSPGMTVPSTIGKDPFVLEARELRGVVSNGMLASPKELAISEDHEGILEITVEAVGEELIKPGTPFKQLFGLDDLIIDIENKMFTHRPDCFGQIGVAREIAGIQQLPYVSPDWYLKPEAPKDADGSSDIKAYGVTVEVPELCPRYMLFGLDNVKIGPSPTWLQAFLTRVGIRPINNIVDMTNYMMVLTGQPLHAFDFDKVAKNGDAQIVVRKPRPGEKLELLDGKTIEPRADAILICDQDKPIGLGGMMGGGNSEIDENTTRILIECANFDMYNIRRSSMEHGIFTDAVTRFNKGQSVWQCPAVLYKAVAMTQEVSPGARPIGKVVDVFNNSEQYQQPEVAVSAPFINERLGLQLAADEIKKLLDNVEFETKVSGDNLQIVAPFWRTDIAIPEDIVEEVGRLYGYDQLPLDLPKRDLTPAPRNQVMDFKTRVRQVLSKAGANEVLTYTFVHGNLLDRAGQDRTQAFELSNALSPDLQYYRLSLTPSLLDKVHPNIKAGVDELAIFEIGKVHNKQHQKDEGNLPNEFPSLALVVARKEDSQGAAYYQARKYLDHLAGQMGIELIYAPVDSDLDYAAAKPYDKDRSALVSDKSGQLLGIIGEFKATTRKALKLPVATAGFELSLADMLKVAKPRQYQALPRFPKVSQDITLRVPADVAYGGLADLLQNELDVAKPEHTKTTLTPLDIYQKDEDHKHVSFRLEIASYERTLTAEEVNSLLDKVAQAAHQTLQAERI